MIEANEAKGEVSAPSAAFGPFGRLPADIRQHIWRIASSLPTSMPGVCIFADTHSEEGKEPLLVVHEPRNPALLGTNTEAHDIALMSPGPARAYDPERDIVFLTNEAFDNFTDNECRHGGPNWVSKIRHLAIGLSMAYWALSRADSSFPLPLAMARLSSLETLSIVYPGPSGEFKFSDAVEPPAEKGTPLRCLTEEELAGLRIEANWMHGTWSDEYPVGWAETGPVHLELIEGVLNNSCCPGNVDEDRLSPLWDHETGRLGIRYEARCFQPLPKREKFHS